MKKNGSPIPFAGSQINETRRVCVRSHPMIIIGGILQQNPFLVPPEEFLREFRERRTGRTASTSMAF